VIAVNPLKTLRDRMKVKVAAILKHSRPVIFNRCASEATLGPIVREFEFKSGETKSVKLQPEAMAAFERALGLCPSLEVTQDYRSSYSGSFRTHEQQRVRYDAYKNGTGNLAAAPCSSWHEAGLAVDILDPDNRKPNEDMTPRAALLACGFHDFRPNDPPHHSYRVDTSNNHTFPRPKWVGKA
jgi:hypothetical protein